MRSQFYVEAILRDTLVPFVEERFPNGYRFQQDNDPKHKSKNDKKQSSNNYTANFSILFGTVFVLKIKYMFVYFLRSSCYGIYQGQRDKLLASTS